MDEAFHSWEVVISASSSNLGFSEDISKQHEEIEEGTKLSSSKTREGSNILLWDLHSGTQLGSFKNNSTQNSSAITVVGEEFLIGAQMNSSCIHTWMFGKSQPHVRSFVSEHIFSLGSSKDGKFCFGGSISGSIYIWDVSTGNLLTSWNAHYKAVTCLLGCNDKSQFISAGEDGVINIWNLIEILDISKIQNTNSHLPLHTWTDHSLSITCLKLTNSGGILFSTSLDRTCRVWDLYLKKLIGTFIFPTIPNSCAVDNLEKSLFVGGNDGKIYYVNLSSFSSLSSQEISSIDTTKHTLKGHKLAITSLVVSFDSSFLISGSKDGVCRVWDTQSLQLLRTFVNQKGPVTFVALIPYSYLLSEKHEKKNPTEPIEPFKKFSSNNISQVKLKMVNSFRRESLPTLSLKRHLSDDINSKIKLLKANGNPNDLQQKVEELKGQILELNSENSRWKIVCNDLFDLCSKELSSK